MGKSLTVAGPFNSLPIYIAAFTPVSPPPPPEPTTAPAVNGSPKTTPQSTTICFRLLCHASRIGSVIGKSGSVIKQMQDEMSAIIRVEDAPSASKFRVISIVADSSVDREVWFGEETDQNDSGFVESSEYREVSAAQEALVRVYERMLSVAAEIDGRYFAPGGVVSCRLLANTTVIGYLIGKGGNGIGKIRNDTGCKIRIFNQDKLPDCAMPDDEMVEIEGGILAVKKALIAVARRIQDSPTAEKPQIEGGILAIKKALIAVARRIQDSQTTEKPQIEGGILAIKKALIAVALARRIQDSQTTEKPQIEGDILAIKRALIGVARRIQDSPTSEKSKTASENRFNGEPMWPNGHMLHSSPARPHYSVKPALPNRHVEYFPPARTPVQEPGPSGSTNYQFGGQDFDQFGAGTSLNPLEVVFRFLCSSDLVGGVIGRSGTIIREIENQTGASIRVEPPRSGCDERLITISAIESPESQNSPAQNAVIRVFSRSVETAYEKGLDSPSSGTPISARLVIAHDQMGCLLGKGGSIVADIRKITGAFIKIVAGNQVARCAETDEVVVMTGEFTNVRDALFSVTSRLRDNLFAKGPKYYQPGNGQPPFDPHASLTQRMDNFRPFNDADYPLPSAPCQSQAGAGNLMYGHDVRGGIELGRGGRSAIITTTTVEILVPENDIGCVYGENGSNLNQLRQISGAKVVVVEPDSGERDYVVVISGSPDETQSAQSLLQAFILADQQWQE